MLNGKYDMRLPFETTVKPFYSLLGTPEKDKRLCFYETDHYIFLIPKNMLPRQWNEYENLPTTAELQIRTLFMHAYAEPQHDIDFKGSGNLPNNIRRQLAWIAASAWGGDHAYSEIIRWMRESGKFPEIFFVSW